MFTYVIINNTMSWSKKYKPCIKYWVNCISSYLFQCKFLAV